VPRGLGLRWLLAGSLDLDADETPAARMSGVPGRLKRTNRPPIFAPPVLQRQWKIRRALR
jgi:hypothetical protein